jgi:hypothetical protein
MRTMTASPKQGNDTTAHIEEGLKMTRRLAREKYIIF